MKHKYNIPGLLLSVVGYRGLPFPGALTAKRPSGIGKGYSHYDVTTKASPQQKNIVGTDLYKQDSKSRWHFMPVNLRHPSIGTKATGHMFELTHAVISLSGKKTIIETPLVGQKGAVKELISMDDYKISVAAIICSDDGTYPEADLAALRDIYKMNESVELVCALTDIVSNDCDMVVITDISFPPLPGVEDAVAVKLEMVTDKPFELIRQ